MSVRDATLQNKKIKNPVYDKAVFIKNNTGKSTSEKCRTDHNFVSKAKENIKAEDEIFLQKETLRYTLSSKDAF